MQNNPLKQFFRRPAVYLKLPSGGQSYSVGTIEIPENGELPIFPMTAIDEITVRTPDALFNGVALVDLISSCVPAIKDPWKLVSSDLDAILIAIKAASGQNSIEIESKCPKCENQESYGLDLLHILATFKYGDYNKLLEINDLKIKFLPLQYKDMNEAAITQFEIQKQYSAIESIEDVDQKAKAANNALKSITELTMRVLALSIEYVQTPSSRVDNKEFILDFLSNCDNTTFTAIRDYNANLKSNSELKPLDVKCVKCKNEYKQPFVLNPVDFFG